MCYSSFSFYNLFLRRIYFFVLLCFFVTTLSAQKQNEEPINKKKLARVWVVVNSKFPDSLITFHSVNLDDKKKLYYAYTFTSNYFTYRVHCPAGTTIPDSEKQKNNEGKKRKSGWVIQKNRLVVFVEGGSAGNRFMYRLYYEVTELSKNTLSLKLVEKSTYGW